jgi:hypothetical protein
MLSIKRVSGSPRAVVQMCTDYSRMLAEQPWEISMIYHTRLLHPVNGGQYSEAKVHSRVVRWHKTTTQRNFLGMHTSRKQTYLQVTLCIFSTKVDAFALVWLSVGWRLQGQCPRALSMIAREACQYNPVCGVRLIKKITHCIRKLVCGQCGVVATRGTKILASEASNSCNFLNRLFCSAILTLPY